MMKKWLILLSKLENFFRKLLFVTTACCLTLVVGWFDDELKVNSDCLKLFDATIRPETGSNCLLFWDGRGGIVRRTNVGGWNRIGFDNEGICWAGGDR